MAYFLNLAGSMAFCWDVPTSPFGLSLADIKDARGHPVGGDISTLVVWGDDVGPAPHPSLNHFFLEKRNGLEIQRKSLSLAVAGCLVVLVGSTDIVFSQAVEERLGSSTPLGRFWLYSHSFAPYCFYRKTVGRIFSTITRVSGQARWTQQTFPSTTRPNSIPAL